MNAASNDRPGDAEDEPIGAPMTEGPAEGIASVDVDGNDRFETVWVYDDPASGIEIHGEPGIGKRVDLTVDLLERFERARQAFELVAEEVHDAAGL